MEHDYKKYGKSGRNFSPINYTVWHILLTVGTSSKPLDSGEIAMKIRKNEDKKMSNEYKSIKKLCTIKEQNSLAPGYLKAVFDDRNTLNFLSERRKEYDTTAKELDKAEEKYKKSEINKDQIKAIEDKFTDIEKRYFKTINRYTKYILSFRGLLLYIYNEYNNKKLRSDKRRVRQVISNPLVTNQAPFLTDYKTFENHGLDVIELLKKISEELYSQLHITAENDNYLLRRATERYFVYVENYFYKMLKSPNYHYYYKKLGTQRYLILGQRVNNFRQKMVDLQKAWLNDRLDVLNSLDRKSFTDNLTDNLMKK
jgi:hypothetical protein